jgi:streptomycin 6-kinase
MPIVGWPPSTLTGRSWCTAIRTLPTPCGRRHRGRARSRASSWWTRNDFLADPTYDHGVVLRGWCPQRLAGDAPALTHHYCALLAGHTGVDETAIREWGFLQRVSTRLYVLTFGADEIGRPYLDSAELLP